MPLRSGPAGGVAPPLLKDGDYVLCAYYPRDVFRVRKIRLSLTQPHYWSYEIRNPRLVGAHPRPPARRLPRGGRGPNAPPLRPGDYNWVAERYLVSYHPPQGELNPDRAIEWVVGKSGALDASTAEPSRAESQREKFIPSALLAPPTAPPTAAPVRSRTRRARARPSPRAHSPLCAANRRQRPTLRQRSASRATRCRW